MNDATAKRKFGRTVDLDGIGASASLLCAAHCALMPLAVTLLPLLGLSFLADEKTEWLIFAVIVILGAVSLGLGYRRHRSRRALALLSMGLGLLAAGHIAEGNAMGWGVPVVVAGGLLVALAHWTNRSLCRACPVCERCESPAQNRRHISTSLDKQKPSPYN